MPAAQSTSFDTFGLSPVLSLDTNSLRDTYHKLAAQNHPDQGGDKEVFDSINRDYQILQTPSKRLKLYMEIFQVEYDPRGSVSNPLIDLFMQVGSLLQTADAFTRKKSSAHSALAKALLENQSIEIQDQLSLLITEVESQQNVILTNLSPPPPLPMLPQTTRDLAFLEKWHAQLQHAYAGLF